MNSMIGEVMFGIMEMMRAVQQGLGRDTAHIEAGATESASHFDTGGFQAQLAGLNGSDVSAGPAADDDDVILLQCRGGG